MEFVTLGLLMLVPLVYLVVAMGRVQAASFAADGSARAAARAFVAAPSEQEGHARARAAVRLGLRDQGFDAASAGSMELRCADDPCLSPGARVMVTVTVEVILPGVPKVVDGAVPAHVTVRATQVATVDLFRPVLP